MANRIINKKQKLLTRKEELLNELKYYEKRIEDARTIKNIPSFYEDDSSDSEIEFSINSGTSITELKLEKSQLVTCLRATEELTDVTVLQSEVNVVVTPPAFEGEREAPVAGDGRWREVMAECRIDLVTFSITFYTHQPCRRFAPVSYRGLSVMPTKLVHERELARAVLPALTTPADAVEVVRSYAAAHRSRRSSLARLADRYADSLYMETLPEGGYVLKCANLLRASWTLQNKWSPVAPFYHKLTFDLEYMDETYIKKIMQAHKQLCDPALDTDDRTLLLAEIIDTCLEARRQMGPDSDADSQNSKTNQKSDIENQNLERPSGQDMDAPVKAPEIMGPPKSLPKKTKAKGKENVVVNERKRGSDGGSGEGTAKKAKTSNSKDNIDKNSKKSNKKSYVSHNVNSKNSTNEEVVENTYFSKNEPSNVDKGNKKTKNLPNVDTKAKNPEVLTNSDLVKVKDSAQTKSKPGNAKTDAKSFENIVSSAKKDKNNDNLNTAENKNLPEKEMKTKNGNSNKSVASKIISAEKEPSNLKEKNNEAKFENIPVNKNKNTYLKASSEKNLKTKTEIKAKDGNEPETKKSKISAGTNKKTRANSENVDTQPIKSPDITEPRSKEKNIPEDKEETEKDIQIFDKNIKNVAKQTQKNIKNTITKTNKDKHQNENLVSAKKQQNFNKNVQSKESLTKSKNNNPKNAPVQNPSNTQTLAERFSKNKIESKNMEEKSNKNLDKNLSPMDNLLQNNAKSKNDNPKNAPVQNPSITQTLAERFSKNKIESKNMEENAKSKNDNPKNAPVQNPSNTQTLAERFSKNKIESKNMEEKSNKNLNKNLSPRDNLLLNNAKSNQNKEFGSNLQAIKTKSNMNVLKPKITKELNKEKLQNIDKIEIEKHNNVKVDKNVPKINSNNNKLTENNQKLRKSLGLKKFATKSNVEAENVGHKQISKIPQKRFPITKTITKNPLRISPRKHHSTLSSTQNSSKSSTKSLQKHTNIPRLLKIPRVKQN